MDFDTIHSPIDCRLLVAFCDLTNFAKLSRDKPSKDIFDIMSQYFELSGDIVEKSGGKIVKFIGDGILIVFPDYLAIEGINTLKELQQKVSNLFDRESYDCLLRVKAHLGSVTCGRIGTRQDKRFDVFGHHVNQTVLLTGSDFMISKELERFIST